MQTFFIAPTDFGVGLTSISLGLVRTLERAGLKTYTQVVDTKDGKRTRVRVGPYANRAEADKAAGRIKGMGLPASVLTL